MKDDSQLIEALNTFFVSEYGEDSEIDKIPDDGIIQLAYTTYDFGDGVERDIQVNFNLTNLKYLNYIDGVLVNKDKARDNRSSIQDFIDEIPNCTAEDLTRDCIDDGENLTKCCYKIMKANGLKEKDMLSMLDAIKTRSLQMVKDKENINNINTNKIR